MLAVGVFIANVGTLSAIARVTSVNGEESPDRYLACEQPRLGAHCPS